MNSDELISKWRTDIDQSKHIFTFTGDGELAWLAELASNHRVGVEQGVYMGRSAVVQLIANPELKLYCVDPFIVQGTEEVARYFLNVFGPRCEIFREYTPKGSHLVSAHAPVDYVFIDGGHDYRDVLQDIDCWIPLVRSGGTLCGHDSTHGDVIRAVRERCPGYTEPVLNIWTWTKP